VTETNPFCQHDISDEQTAKWRQDLHEARGTKRETEILVHYWFAFSKKQLNAISYMIAMRAYQTPDSLPDPTEINEADSASRDGSLDLSSSSSVHTIVQCDKPTLKERQREKATVCVDIGRACKIAFFSDPDAGDPNNHEFVYENMILFECTMGDQKEFAYENLAVFLENNKGQSIKQAAKKWKKAKQRYSPLPPNDLILAQYSHLVKRNKVANLPKKNALKKTLQKLQTLDFETFKKESSVIGEDNQIDWENAAEFKEKVTAAVVFYQREVVNKRGGLGLGSQFTVATVSNLK